MKQRVVIFGNGNLEKSFLTAIKPTDYVIGVDLAAYWLIVHGVTPDAAIGDFDSTTKKELKIIKDRARRVLSYPAKKDFTDMELAIRYALKQKPTSILIYGGSGTRLDHTLSSIHLLLHGISDGVDVVFRDTYNEIFVVQQAKVIKKQSARPYVSVLPLGDSLRVSLKGFVYEVDHALIRQGQSIGVSNELAAPMGIIEVHEGIALIVRSRDAKRR